MYVYVDCINDYFLLIELMVIFMIFGLQEVQNLMVFSVVDILLKGGLNTFFVESDFSGVIFKYVVVQIFNIVLGIFMYILGG